MNGRNLALTLFAALLMACGKEDPPILPTPNPPPTPTDTTGTVMLSIQPVYGALPFDPGASYSDGVGNVIRITALRFYVSGIHLIDDLGSTVATYPDLTLLVDASTANNTFTLGTMAPGSIHELHFTLGLDSATNYADPTLAEHPLNIPDMHWFWNPSSGYIFLKVEGFVDINGNGTFEPGEDTDFAYHCAQNSQQSVIQPVLRTHLLQVQEDIAVGQTITIAAQLDVEALLAGLDILSDPIVHGNGATNQLLMDGLVNAIMAP